MKYVFEKKKKKPYLCCLCFLKTCISLFISPVCLVSMLCGKCQEFGGSCSCSSERWRRRKEESLVPPVQDVE